MRRASWILSISLCLGCGGANRSEYATAAGFAAVAGAIQAVELTQRTQAAPPPCGQDVYVCPGSSERVCATDRSGCRVCSCERLPPHDVSYDTHADWWH